jgi:hypothetical protein
MREKEGEGGREGGREGERREKDRSLLFSYFAALTCLAACGFWEFMCEIVRDRPL